MPDTRRQTIIIAVLIVLIAVAGVFAKRFNEGIQNTSAGQTEGTQAATTIDQMRITHDNNRNASKQDYESIINDSKQTAEAKSKATGNYMALIERGEKENQVELKLMEQGFEDALCIVGDGNVELYVKSGEQLTREHTAKIMDTVVKTTSIAPKYVTIKSGK